MNTNSNGTTFAGTAARHLIWLNEQIDWTEVREIVLHGLVAAAILTFWAGYALGTAIHQSSATLGRWHCQLLGLTATAAAPTPEAPVAPPAPVEVPHAPAAPVQHPLAALAEGLEALPATKLRQLAGTRSKRPRKTELVAQLVAC